MKNIIQIDLGTAITKVMLNGTIEKNIPTVVGFQTKNDRINTAIGYEAEQPLFQEVFPLKHGVIADYDALKCFVKSLRRMACRSLPLYRWFLPTHYTFLFHADATSQEEKLLRNVIRQAGIKHFSIANTSSLFLCENQIILDLGAGVSSAMLFQDGVMTDVVSENFGGDDLTEEIQQYVLSHCDCLIGTKSAENIKKSCRKQQQIKGLDSLTKIPTTVEIPGAYLQKMRDHYIRRIAQLVSEMQAAHPDALVTELGLSGGASQLSGLKYFLERTIYFYNRGNFKSI